MAQQTKVAYRYARAIFDYIGDKKACENLVKNLRELADLVQNHNELFLVFNSEVFSSKQRDGIIDDLANKVNFSEDLKKILKVLSRSKRLGLLRAVADELHNLLLQTENIIPLKVESADNLKPEEKNLIKQRFNSLLRKKVEANYILEPKLIGGVRVTAEGRTYNGTLAGWFDTFEEMLVGG